MYKEEINCHGGFTSVNHMPKWEVRDSDNLRHCSYCGSLHPEDLSIVLTNGAKLNGADWKYGWPHKFYVEGIPNPVSGQEVQQGSHSYLGDDGQRVEEPIMGIAPKTITAKFYNKHLEDLAGQPEFEPLVRLMFDKQSGKYYPRAAFIDNGNGTVGYAKGVKSYDEGLEIALQYRESHKAPETEA